MSDTIWCMTSYQGGEKDKPHNCCNIPPLAFCCFLHGSWLWPIVPCEASFLEKQPANGFPPEVWCSKKIHLLLYTLLNTDNILFVKFRRMYVVLVASKRLTSDDFFHWKQWQLLWIFGWRWWNYRWGGNKTSHWEQRGTHGDLPLLSTSQFQGTHCA